MKILSFLKGSTTSFMRVCAMLVMMFTSSVMFADYQFPAYISDLKLVGGTEAETKELLRKYKSEGWTCTEYDLNYGCKSGADRIYLLYKSTVFASTNGGFVTDLIIHNDKWKETTQKDGRTYYAVPYEGGKHFVKVHGDLNSNAGGGDYHLYYTKENFPNKKVVDDIRIYATTEKDVDLLPLLREYEVCGWNLNGGCKGCKTKLFLYWRTQTKVNRPETSQLFYNSLVYNGESQTLIKPNIVAKNGCTLMFEVDDKENKNSYSIYTSDINKIKAKGAGNHTVYVYAKGNEYGVESGVASYTVKIAKASNNKVTINVPSFEYGIEKNVSKLSLSGTNLSTGKVTYMFATSENGNYTTAVPTMFGLYYVKATIEGDANCYTYTTKPEMIPLLDWEGKGTQDRPYVIRTTEDLDRLATRVNEGVTYEGSYFWLANDIAYTGTNNFTPIGGAANQYNGNWNFRGNFDGNGKIISGINVNSSNDFCGLFGFISGAAVVKNVTLSNCKFKGGSHTAALVGYCRGTVVNNVVKDVVVEGVSLSGCLIGNHASATVNNNLVANSSITSTGLYFGVICGYYDSESKSTFSNNYYVNCHAIQHSNRNVNIGTVKGDITENDGAVSLHTLTFADGVKTSTIATKIYGGTNYSAPGTTITLDYDAELDESCNLRYNVNGEYIESNSFTMPAKNVVVSASLVQKKFAVKLGGNDLTGGSVTGDGEYVYGSTVTVTATTNEGYVFVGWMDGDENIVSTEASYRFTATDNQRLTAVFKVDESTGIETVNAQSDEDVWYTLNGHKLAGKPTQKGVYIHNNKKVIIK